MEAGGDGGRRRQVLWNPSSVRRTVDHNATGVQLMKERVFTPDLHTMPVSLVAHTDATAEMLPPSAWRSNATSALCTRFLHTSYNKDRSSVNAGCWTPDGRRMLTASNNGMFTVWSAFSFSFEATQQAHEHPLHCLQWSHSGRFLVSGDHAGILKYWQTTLNNVKEVPAHPGSPVRAISFCPTDAKFCTGADDCTVRVWDTSRAACERLLPGAGLDTLDSVRSHRWDVKCAEWHPQKSLVVSGSKDQTIKLWDPKAPREVAVLHLHKGPITQVRWHGSGQYLLSSSRDAAVKLFDLRAMREASSFRAHKREVTSLAWHPVHAELFASGGQDGSVNFWVTTASDPVAAAFGGGGFAANAHESAVLGLAWHPLGHLLATFSQDMTTKFWARVRPGEARKREHSVYCLCVAKSREPTASSDDEPGLLDTAGSLLAQGHPQPGSQYSARPHRWQGVVHARGPAGGARGLQAAPSGGAQGSSLRVRPTTSSDGSAPLLSAAALEALASMRPPE